MQIKAITIVREILDEFKYFASDANTSDEPLEAKW